MTLHFFPHPEYIRRNITSYIWKVSERDLEGGSLLKKREKIAKHKI